MKQATLQFKTRIQNVSIMNNNIETGKIILNTMLFILVILAICYMLILGNTVFDIVQRKTLEKEMSVLSNEVSNLELSYLSTLSSVDINLSSSMGFRETKTAFATRKSFGSIKLAKNEI